jgi:hypothetical protein
MSHGRRKTGNTSKVSQLLRWHSNFVDTLAVEYNFALIRQGTIFQDSSFKLRDSAHPSRHEYRTGGYSILFQ